MGSNEEIIQLLQKTQTIFKQTQRDKEEKYLNDIIQLQDKIKDLENVVCKMGRSTDTLRLLTSEQKAFKDNLHKSGVGYNGPFVLSQAYAKIPKLYRASELCDKNEQLHVFDSEETLEDAEKSQLKMNEFQKDEKVQELKIQPIDYEKLNKLYKDFVPQKELSAEQTYFSSSSIPCVKDSVKILETKSMPSESPLIKELYNIKVGFEKLSLLIKQNSKRASIFYTSPAEIERIEFCQKQVKPILNELQVYLDAFQDLFHRDIKEMKDAFEQNDVYLDEIENQNDLLKDQLLEASLTADIKNLVITSCMEIRNKDLHDEIERISKESNDVSFEVTQGLSKRIVELEKDLSKSEAKSIAFEIALQHKSRENNSLKTVQKENENFMASLQLKNSHLKQTYKDLFESVQRSKVETHQCDEAKVKDDFDEIETRNIELEYRVASLIKENEHLKLSYKNLFDSIKKSQFLSISFIRSQASVRDSFSCWEKAHISLRSQSKRARGKNRLMKAVRSSSHVLIIPSLSSSSYVFASLVSDRGNIIRWLPLMANSFVVSGMVIEEPKVRATTRSAAYTGSSSMGLRFLMIRYQESGIGDSIPLHDYMMNFVVWIGGHVPFQCYACSDSLLLTPLCCDDIHDVTPRVSALARCDRLVSEPLVIENLGSYYRRFIANSSKVAKPLALLTQKIQKYEWAKEQQEAFQTLKDNLCDAPILSLPDGSKEFVVYCDASNQGLGCVLMQRGKAEIGESSLIGPELVQETTDKVVLLKEKLKAARDRQKSYANNRRKPLEFEVGYPVLLKMSPWKGVIRFGKKGKLALRNVEPFEIIKGIGPMAY
ncbi:reverse transcriptase zinc-binding domain-containing protein [Tanacetum coccineum]